MERIEYVQRMEDYAAWIQFEMLYIRRLGLRMKFGALRHWIIVDMFLFTTLFIAHIGWIYLSTVIAVMTVTQIFLVLGQTKSIRQSALEEAQRAYASGKQDSAPQAIWFDQDKVVDEETNLRMEIRWEGIHEMTVSPDWLALRFGALSIYVKRSSVINGDFNHFVATIMKQFQEAKQRQGLEPKYNLVDKTSK